MPTQAFREQVEMTGHLPRVSAKARWWRDALVFLAGAQAFHTLSHIWLGLSGILPLEIQHPAMTITANLNVFAILTNLAITAALLYGALRLSKR